jgi:hypothetical protein
MPDQSAEKGLIDHLRREAFDVKTCFASFCNQVMMFSGAVLALTFTFVAANPFAIYAPLPVILVLMNVARVGIHKYSTANRNAAYELHLSRTANLKYMETVGEDARWKHWMREMGWEEALRAWRVVQPTLFRTVYISPRANKLGRGLSKIPLLSTLNWFIPSHYRYTAKVEELVKDYSKLRARTPGASVGVIKDYPWFLPGLLVEATADQPTDQNPVYYTGSYLEIMLATLFYLQILMLFPLLVAVLKRPPEFSINAAILVAVLCLVVLRQIRIRKRRVMLEDGFLSIHSSAIVWQAVAYAHHRALEELKDTYAHYTENLARVAAELADHAFHVHDWLRQTPGVIAPPATAGSIKPRRACC